MRRGLPAALLLAIALTGCHPAATPSRPPAVPPLGSRGYESWAREQFARRHPGEKPADQPVGEAAVRFHRSRPMGTFKLATRLGQPGNDCSDFVACCIDEGLGVKARFNRGSNRHLYGEDLRLVTETLWRPGVRSQVGDAVAVRHSPWYAPVEESCWHVGVVGSDGMVYDFVKLRRWKQARYGRNSFDWFVRHSPSAGQVILARLRPEYRYHTRPLPP
ncbi:MAG: hypothetical protein HYU66_09435 [Armatimonadetes bacterium]|nr:hypothetical protein [Armatimonadota bacterium]